MKNIIKPLAYIAVLLFSFTTAKLVFAQTQKGSDILGDPSTRLGWSVSISRDGNSFAAGARYGGGGPGGVKVFDWDGFDWSQRGSELAGDSVFDEFGTSVSMSASGNIVAVGAHQNDSMGTNAGQVKVFSWSGTAWEQKGSNIFGLGNLAHCGQSVSLDSSGNALAVGVPSEATGSVFPGYAAVYEWSGTDWVQKGSNIFSSLYDERFGFCVNLNADATILAVAAPYGDAGIGAEGYVCVYEWSGSSWVQKGDTLYGIHAGDLNGFSLDLSDDGSTLALGTATFSASPGYTRVYDWSGSNWVLRGSEIPGEVVGDRSGYSVCLSSDGSIVAIGAKYNGGGGIHTGHVRLYGWYGTTWLQRGVDINGEVAFDESGFSISLSGDGTTVAIGAIYNDAAGTDAGQVRVFEICEVDLSVTVSDPALTSNQAGATYQWIDCDLGGAPIPGETSQVFTAVSNGNYAVIVTHAGCSDTSACYPIISIDTREPAAQKVRLYPNPSSGHVNLDLPDEMLGGRILLRNDAGQTVSVWEMATRQFYLDLPQTCGLYSLEIISPEGHSTYLRVMRL